MAGRKQGKECIDIRVCIDQETYQAIKRYQGKRISEDQIDYKRWEAASDLFNELVRNSKDK